MLGITSLDLLPPLLLMHIPFLIHLLQHFFTLSHQISTIQWLCNQAMEEKLGHAKPEAQVMCISLWFSMQHLRLPEYLLLHHNISQPMIYTFLHRILLRRWERPVFCTCCCTTPSDLWLLERNTENFGFSLHHFLVHS